MKEVKTVNITLPSVAPISSSKIILTNEWNRDTLFVSLYPQPRTEKPTDIGIISSFIAGFPNIFTLDQLKKKVAINGKSFIGAFFFDMNFYKKVYGGVSSLAIAQQTLDNAYLLWGNQNVPYNQNRLMEEQLSEQYNNLVNSARLKEEYFILLSTFGLDVDHKQNENGEDITPAYGEMYKEVRQRIIELDLNTLFAYKTFSDPIKGERFRIIFKTDVPIFNWDLARSLLLGLEQIFQEYFDPACKNVNRVYHGGNKLIEETHPLFGTAVDLDKFFQILLQVFKEKYKSNYARHLEQFARDTGLVIRNNAFAIRTVELSDDEIKELRKNELDAYNKDFMKDYHFSISADTHKEFFQDDNFDENIGTYYIYILKYDDFVRNGTKVFYEICMSSNKVNKQKERETKANNEESASEDKQEESIYEVYKQNVKLEPIQVKDWKPVEEKCELYKIFVNGGRRVHHNELFTLCTSLMYIVGGEKRFLETIDRFPALYNEEKDRRWKATFDYNKRQGYNPVSCNLYCPFATTCKHLKNMRDTVAPRNGIYVVASIDFVDISKIEQQLEKELKTFYKERGYLLYE